jgi:hypothetical protein
MRRLPFDVSHQDAFFMYWGCQLKISIALNPKKKPYLLYFYRDGTSFSFPPLTCHFVLLSICRHVVHSFPAIFFLGNFLTLTPPSCPLMATRAPEVPKEQICLYDTQDSTSSSRDTFVSWKHWPSGQMKHQTQTMMEDNLVNNDLTLNALGIVSRQFTSHLNVLTSAIAPLTSDMDNIINERNYLCTEMVRLYIIDSQFERDRTT